MAGYLRKVENSSIDRFRVNIPSRASLPRIAHGLCTVIWPECIGRRLPDREHLHGAGSLDGQCHSPMMMSPGGVCQISISLLFTASKTSVGSPRNPLLASSAAYTSWSFISLGHAALSLVAPSHRSVECPRGSETVVRSRLETRGKVREHLLGRRS